jgi:hypothetical protein
MTVCFISYFNSTKLVLPAGGIGEIISTGQAIIPIAELQLFTLFPQKIGRRKYELPLSYNN